MSEKKAKKDNDNKYGGLPVRKWVVPPGLRRLLDRFDAVCSVLFHEEDEGMENRPLLICGPTGVGKTILSYYAIDKYFIINNIKNESRVVRTLNCATIQKDLFESELFGHVKGAYTGAIKDRKGIFELAGKGVL